MGSYNRICAVSNTPIMKNQKARVFYLVMNVFEIAHYNKEKDLFKTTFSDNHCYSHENFKIIGYPLLATYNEYSMYDFDDPEMVQVTLDVLNENFFPNQVGKDKKLSDYNPCHDYIGLKHLKDMNIVQDMIKSGSLRVMSVHGIASVAEMAIHEDIYQQLILKDGWDSGHSDDKKIDFNSLVSQKMKKYIGVDSLIISDYDKDIFSMMNNTLEGQEQSVIDEVTKKYNQNLKNSGRYDLDHFSDERQSTLTFPKRDIHRYDCPSKIIEGWIGSIWTDNWFEKHSILFHAPMTSQDEHDYHVHNKRFNDVSKIINELKTPYGDTEEFLDVEKIVEYRLSHSQVETKITEWFGKDDEQYEAFKNISVHISYNNINAFIVGDQSEVDVFFDEFELINPSLKGTLIHLDF